MADTRRVALATCAELPQLDPTERLVLEPLEQRGVTAVPAVWDDPAVDWDSFDLTVIRSTWDYTRRREAFVSWAACVPRLANPADVIAWNTDKRYLADLAAAGVPVVPTSWIVPGERWTLPDSGEWVLKPSVSAGSVATGRYDMTDPEHRQLAAQHIDRLHTAGKVVMLQPYLSAVDTAGETALLYFNGEFSHAIRKGPMLTGPDRGTGPHDALYVPEEIQPRQASAEERELAEKILTVVPGGVARLLYARVDLIPGPDGQPTLIELELVEPSLFLNYDPGAPERFAAAIVAALDAR